MNVRALMLTVSWPHFSYYQRRCGYCQEASTLLVSSLSCDLPSEHCSESSLTCVQTLPRWVERDQTYRVTDRPGLSVLKIKLVNLFFCILFILFYLFLFLFSYNCLHFLPIPPPHPSQSHLPPPPLPSHLILSLCPL